MNFRAIPTGPVISLSYTEPKLYQSANRGCWGYSDMLGYSDHLGL